MDAANNRIVVSSHSTAPTLTYANTVQGSTSSDSPKSITVLNLGNLDLAIKNAVFATSTPTTDTSFTNDTATTTCTSTLAANGTCVYGIDFTPAAAGTNSGSLTFTIGTPSTIAVLQHYGSGASVAFAVLLLPLGFRLRREGLRQPSGTLTHSTTVTLTVQ